MASGGTAAVPASPGVREMFLLSVSPGDVPRSMPTRAPAADSAFEDSPEADGGINLADAIAEGEEVADRVQTRVK